MKKLLIIYFLICTSMNLFAQNYDYGLSQDDLNLLLGYFVPDKETLKRPGREQSFSWGKQTVINTDGDYVLIDYNNKNWGGNKYENYLLIAGSGYTSLITNIEKIFTNKFKLSLVSIQYYEVFGFQDEGYLIITFLDTVHAVIDKTNYRKGFFNYGMLLKTAGPVLTE